MKKQGRVRITYELLEDVLNLPPGHHVVDVFQTGSDRETNFFSIKITGDKMPARGLEGSALTEMPLEDLCPAEGCK